MAIDMVIDDRLPPLVEITEPSRQQKRRVERRPTPCPKCRYALTADDACFADGQDAHRSCAEMWNFAILGAYDELCAQDQTELAV